MNTIVDRLKRYLQLKRIPRTRFEKMAGLSNGYMNKVHKNPGADKIERILTVLPELNRDWLLTGAGEMEKPEPQKETPAQNKLIVGGEDFSPATDSGDIRIDVGAPELAIKVGTLQTRLKDALDKIKEKDQYIADLKNHIADLRDMITTLKIQIESLKADRQ